MLEKASYIRNAIVDRNIESCLKITPEQMEIIAMLSMEHDNYKWVKEGKPAVRNYNPQKQQLLMIELEDETSAPKVFYKGEEITHKQNVFLEWDTDTDIMGGLTYSIEHADLGKGYPVTNRIERKVKGHACD